VRQLVPKARQIPALDGLRGLAVLTVMLHHLVPDLQVFGTTTAIIADFGWIGVDLFFVLSGFLITGVLLDSKTEENYFRNFYWRRILRVWPLYYTMVAAIYLIGPHLKLAAGWNISQYSPFIYVLFVQNILLSDWGIYPLTPSWSLAIEEQFYAFWPLGVRFLSLRTIRYALLSLVCLSPVARGWAVHFGSSWHQIYTFTWFRLDGLATGALIAILFRTPNFNEHVWRRRAKFAAVIGGIGAILTLALHALPKSGTESIWIYSWVALASGGVVLLSAGTKPVAILEISWLRYTGQISYGLYLLHTPVFALMNVISRHIAFNHGKLFFASLVLSKVILAAAVASVSWYGLERPISRFKNYFQKRKIASAEGDKETVPALSNSGEIAHLKKRASQSMMALFVRYGMAIGINVVGTVILSRLVGPKIWGAFAIAQVLYMSSQEIFGRGIANYLIKKETAPSAADIGTTFCLQHLIGLFFLLVAILGANLAAHWYAERELLPLLFAAAVASYLYSWRSIPVALLERDLDYVSVAVVEILDSVVFSATAILFAWIGHPVTGLTIAIAARAFVSTVAAYFLKPVRPALFLSRNSLPGVADFGGFVMGSSMLNIVILFVPALFAGKLVGISGLGQIQMGFSLFGNLLFASAAILRLSFSAYSRMVAYPGELQRIVNNNLETAAATLVPAVVLFAGLSPVWTPFVFGEKWSALPVLLWVLAPAYLLSSVFWGILNSMLAVCGRQRLVFLFLACFMAIYAPTTLLLAAKFGLLGVAAAFSVTHVLLYPFLFWISGRTLGSLRYRKIVFELAKGGLFTSLLWAVSRYSVLAAGVVTCIYLALWYLGNSQTVGALIQVGRTLVSRPIVTVEES